MIDKRYGLRSLTLADWRIAGEAWVLFVLVEIGLRALPLKVLLVLLEKGVAPVRRAQDGELPDRERVTDLAQAVAWRHVLKPNCLKTALVVYRLLRRNGIEAELVIGTRRVKGKLEGHAWVEHRGHVVLGGVADGGYVPLPRFGGGRSLPASAILREQRPRTPGRAQSA